MTSLKALSSTFMMSIAAHAVLGYAMVIAWSPAAPNTSDAIQIDYVGPQTAETAPSTTKAESGTEIAQNKGPAAVTRKKVKGIPVPRVEASDFQKIVDERIKKQLSQLKVLDAPPAPETRVSSSMTSAELIADPVKGNIFIGYFGEVKKKIQGTVFRKAGRNLYGSGSVCLGFVLGSEGQLEHLTILPNGTNADSSMKELAAQCIRDSAPFGNFPKDLGPRHIYFNITIFFDGS